MQETFDSTNNIEHIKYFSKNGDLIVEIKNNKKNFEDFIYDLYSKKFWYVKMVLFILRTKFTQLR